MTESPGTKPFDEEVACARLGVAYKPEIAKPETAAGRKDAAEGTLQWLVGQYRNRIGNRVNQTLLSRRLRLLEEICDSLHKEKRRGDLPFALMERKHVLEMRDSMKSTPGAQNEVVKTLSALFGWAVENELSKGNPATGIKRLNVGDGFHAWTKDEVERFEARHPVGSKARLALHLGMYTGLRLADIAIVGRQHVKDGWLTIRPGKTKRSSGVVVEIPILAALQATIDASPCGEMTFLVSEWKAPFTVNSLGNKMRDWCDQAGLPLCSMHGLRKAGATLAAENGATDEDLMAIFGWTSKQQTTLYTRSASRKRIAGRAIHKLLREQKKDEPVPPNEAVGKSGTKRPKKSSNIKG
ncbi:tyrosine-type recombinase/integrase [Mesorhizobium sp. 128a]